MNEQNNESLKRAVNVLAMIVMAMLTIVVCAGVWNYCPEPWVNAMAVVLLAVNGFIIYRFWKKKLN